MKNIFKFMGIALMACSLTFVSCSSDDENEEGGNTNNPSFTATLGSETMTVIDFKAADHSDEGYLTVYGYESTASDSRFVQGFLETTPGTYDYEGTDGDIMSWRDPSYIYTDTEGLLGDAGGQYWGYTTNPSSFQENVTAVDLNALTMSATWTAEVFHIEDYIAAGGMNGIEMTPFSGSINNMTWTWAQ